MNLHCSENFQLSSNKVRVRRVWIRFSWDFKIFQVILRNFDFGPCTNWDHSICLLSCLVVDLDSTHYPNNIPSGTHVLSEKG